MVPIEIIFHTVDPIATILGQIQQRRWQKIPSPSKAYNLAADAPNHEIPRHKKGYERHK